jgi:hypothetical protein
MPRIKRATRHGLRLDPRHRIADSLQGPAQKAMEWATKALENSQPLDERQRFVLIHMLKAAERLQAPPELKGKLGKELEDRVDEGERLHFSRDDISGMNASVFLIDNEKQLLSFIKQVRERLEGKKKKPKESRSSPSSLGPIVC